MAIVKVSYTRRAAGAKAGIRFIAHRPTAAGQPVARQLFGTEGAMSRHDAYNLIDEAGRGSVFFRIVISKLDRGHTREQHREEAVWELQR